jgi:hypothetical protein
LTAAVEDVKRAELSLTEQYRLGELDYIGLVDGLGRLDRVRLSVVAVRQQAVSARLELLWLEGGPGWDVVAEIAEEVE